MAPHCLRRQQLFGRLGAPVLRVENMDPAGARIAVTVLPLPDNWAAWSPGGYVIALMMQGIDPETLKALHRSLWWIHAMTAFVFIAYLSYGKLAHIFYGLTNIFMRNLGPSGVLHHPDIEDALENDPDSLDSLGVENIRQFPWKGLMDLDACTNCGRCEQVCPAHGSGVALNPRKLIQDMQGHLNSVGPSLLQASDSAVVLRRRRLHLLILKKKKARYHLNGTPLDMKIGGT